MGTEFEHLNQKRNMYRGYYLIALGAFLLIWFARSTLRLSNLGMQTLEDCLLAILLICVLFQAFFVRKEVAIKMTMKKDPHLLAMMNDELVRLNELKAWRAAFFTLVAYIVLVMVLTFFIEIQDLGWVLVTGLLVGFGSYNATAYWLNR